MFESPYPIVENPDGTYSFLSDYGINYSIALFDASFHFNNIVIPDGNIVEFSFGADKELPIDKKVTDDKWFLKYGHTDLEKYDFSFSLDDIIITAAVIIDAKNTEREVLLSAFLESYQVYSDYKS